MMMVGYSWAFFNKPQLKYQSVQLFIARFLLSLTQNQKASVGLVD
jgi:hypothetical protein